MDRSSVQRTMSRIHKVGIPYITRQLHLMDVWRTLYPLERDFTCLSAAYGTLSRIDYILASESLFPWILEAYIEPICLTDHALSWVRVALHIDRGPYRQWRFPSHRSQSAKFREALTASWVAYANDNKEHATNSPLLFWQAAKPVIIGNILSPTTQRDKKMWASYTKLQLNLTSAYTKFKDHPTLANKEAYLSWKLAFEALLTQLVAKYTFASRSRFHRYGNRSGRLLWSGNIGRKWNFQNPTIFLH